MFDCRISPILSEKCSSFVAGLAGELVVAGWEEVEEEEALKRIEELGSRLG